VNTDYQKLCVALFGTDDINELKKIAKEINNKNSRNAGRKKKFTQDDVREMKRLIADGVTVNEVARRFHTSRQVVGKYINTKPKEGYTLRMTYMYKQHPCTVIDVDFLNRRVMIENKTRDIFHRAFGVVEEPTWNDFEEFLKERCYSAARGDIKNILAQFRLTDYDPLQIVEKTRGRTVEDDMWLRFNYYPRGGMVRV